MMIEEIIQEWANETNTKIMMHKCYKDKTVDIISRHPGFLIGKHGCLFDKYGKKIEEMGYKVHIIEAQEEFIPGNNWSDIICARAEAFFDTEYED